MSRLTACLALVAAALTGCATPDPAAGEGGEPLGEQAEAGDPVDRSLVVGRWRIVDDQLGSMELTVADDLECVLVDSRGKRWEFEAEEEDEGLQASLDVSERGLKVLINQPETSLEVAGSMNYSKGEAVLVFSPEVRDGQKVLWLRVYRESRREDTQQSINLLPVAPEVAEPDGGGE